MRKLNFFGKPYPFLFLCLITYLGCSRPETDSKKVYHIIGQEETVITDVPIDPSEPPPPPAPFYGDFNLILVGESDLYFHRVQPPRSYHEMPDKIILTKWDVKKIDFKQLPEFLETEYSNVDQEDFKNYFTCIKSSSDTISNLAFPKIQAFFKRIKFNAYVVRKWTAQEKQVVESINSD